MMPGISVPALREAADFSGRNSIFAITLSTAGGQNRIRPQKNQEIVSKIIKNTFVGVLVQAHGLLCNRGTKSKERE
jgi:hypothetical protein